MQEFIEYIFSSLARCFGEGDEAMSIFLEEGFQMGEGVVVHRVGVVTESYGLEGERTDAP